jgi:hypothetical protein
MKDRDRLPAHLCTTQRRWRQQKRAELERLRYALEMFRVGCAYTPAYADVLRMSAILNKLKRALSVKEWGR